MNAPQVLLAGFFRKAEAGREVWTLEWVGSTIEQLAGEESFPEDVFIFVAVGAPEAVPACRIEVALTTPRGSRNVIVDRAFELKPGLPTTLHLELRAVPSTPGTFSLDVRLDGREAARSFLKFAGKRH